MNTNTPSLETAISSLYCGNITKFEISMDMHRIYMHVKQQVGENTKNYDVIFNGVSSYYFVDGIDNDRLGKPDWDYMELTDIIFRDKPKRFEIVCNDTTLGEAYHSSYNFVLEIWSSIMLIEARSIEINRQLFEVD